jgi:hypothetical protein
VLDVVVFDALGEGFGADVAGCAAEEDFHFDGGVFAMVSVEKVG